MKKFYISLSSLILLAFLACDKIDDPIPKNLGKSISLGSDVEFITDPTLNIEDTTALKNLIANSEWDTTLAPDNSNRRFIVLEEFTGHTCIFCPAGTREILRLDDSLKEQLIPVAVHAGNFARPRSSGEKYIEDFRVEGGHGETYLTQFNPGNAYPRGMVNRKGGNSVSSNAWAQDIAEVKDDAPLAILRLTNYLDEVTNLLRVNLEVEWKETLSEDYKIQLYLVEDHIIAWQKDGNEEKENYDHRHVLRKVVNDTYGKALKPAVSGEIEKIQYIFPFKDSWNVDNLETVAFIFNGDPSSFEIIQGNAAYTK